MEYKYRLVVFINKKKKKDIEIVPKNWFNYDDATDILTCKFMPGPYNNQTRAILSRMLKNCEEPLPEWPNYPVDLRGRACTYEEAEAKALKLETNTCVYTTENEEHSQKTANADRKKFMFKSVSLKESLIPEELSNVSIDLNANFPSSEGFENVHGSAGTKPENMKASKIPKSSHSNKIQNSKPIAVETHFVEEVSEKSPEEGRCQSTAAKQDTQTANKDFKVTKKKMYRRKAGDSQLRRLPSSSSSESLQDLHSSASDEPTNSKPVAVKEKSVLERYPQKGLRQPAALRQEDMHKPSTNKILDDRFLDFVDEKFRSTNYTIGEIKSKLINIEAILNAITNQLANRCVVDEVENPGGKDWVLPCQSHEEFVKFDGEISTDNELKQKIIRQIIFLINKKSPLRRNLGRILRGYMSRNLALMFTTARAVPGKYVFAETKLYACLKVAVSQVFKEEDGSELSFQTFKAAIQAVFNNAKDWDGQGSKRKQVERR